MVRFPASTVKINYMHNFSSMESEAIPQIHIGQRFLWWLATADAHLLKSLSADANRTSLLGWMVACTWIFATLSWCYFFYTVVPTWYAWLPLGVLMGWIILCIDRMLMSGLQPSKKGAYKAFLLRVALASLLGAFLAQPAMLFLFKKEIAVQQSIDQELRVQNKITAYRSSISPIRNEWTQKEESFKLELDSLEKASRNAAAAYLAEADGTGGSKQRGISNIALAKKAAWEKMEEKYQEAQLRLIPLRSEMTKNLQQLDAEEQKQIALFRQMEQDGFLQQIAALSNLLASSFPLQVRYYLLLAILMLIELLPVIGKWLLERSSYDSMQTLQNELQKDVLSNELQLHYQQQLSKLNRDTLDIKETTQSKE